jgi:hypothetical protein
MDSEEHHWNYTRVTAVVRFCTLVLTTRAPRT